MKTTKKNHKKKQTSDRKQRNDRNGGRRELRSCPDRRARHLSAESGTANCAKPHSSLSLLYYIFGLFGYFFSGWFGHLILALRGVQLSLPVLQWS